MVRERDNCYIGKCFTNLFLLLHLLHEYGTFLVLATFVLEPDAYDARRQRRHLDQLLLHEGVRARVGVVARPQGVKLLLVQHGPNAGRLLMVDARAVLVRVSPAATAVTTARRTLRRTGRRTRCAAIVHRLCVT